MEREGWSLRGEGRGDVVNTEVNISGKSKSFKEKLGVGG